MSFLTGGSLSAPSTPPPPPNTPTLASGSVQQAGAAERAAAAAAAGAMGLGGTVKTSSQGADTPTTTTGAKALLGQ